MKETTLAQRVSLTGEHVLPPIILVVEADEALGALLALALSLECSWRVLLARDSREALHLLETVTPDLLLIDDELPGLTGRELYKRLCTDKQQASIPTLLIDADAPGGMRSYPHFIRLRKPFDLLQLLDLLQQLLSAAHPTLKQ
jgi:CheY-like chemotaxis protein